jgi:hypothetical protein
MKGYARLDRVRTSYVKLFQFSSGMARLVHVRSCYDMLGQVSSGFRL